MTLHVARLARSMVFGLVAFEFLSACSPDATARDRKRPASTIRTIAAAPNTLDLGPAEYREISLPAFGGVSGAITRSSADTTSTAAQADIGDCTPSRSSMKRRSTTGVPNAIVWIVGANAGKALPEDKRAEIDSDECGLDPRVQAVIVGTTVNVMNDDKVLHRLVFTRGTDTLTTMPFFNEGEIVPSERLAKSPGMVDVTCAFHPRTHGHVAVFAHPYFTVTDDAGRFAIDSVPPGNYTLRIWRDGDTRPTEQRVAITAGVTSKMDVALK